MINYARHDEEFHGIFKLSNGEEILAKAVITEDEGESLVFIQDPVRVESVTKQVDEDKMVRGMGFARWMQMSDEEFFILREKDIVTVASMSKEIAVMYEAFILGEDISNKKISRSQTNVKDAAGYVGKIDEARKMFEKIYKENKS